MKLVYLVSQVYVYIGMLVIECGNLDYFLLFVGNYMLGGGGFVFWLMKEVCDKCGFVYSVYSYFMLFC